MMAALTVATAPVFLYQSFQPMSDLPVTAAWMVCWSLLIRAPQPPSVRRHDPSVGETAPAFRLIAAGAAAAVGVLIRPNLAPLAIVPLMFIAQRSARDRRLTDSFCFAGPVGLAGLFLAWVQWRWYGSPVQSGYGSALQLYSLAYIGPNLVRYSTWLVTTSPAFVLALLAGGAFKRTRLVAALAVFAALNLVAYLIYFVFEEWSYLRFLLPGLAIAAVFVGLVIAEFLGRVATSLRAVLLLAAALTVSALGLWEARALDVFRLADAHRRIVLIDRYLEAALPERALIVAGEQSGAVRLDTGHDIVRWEAASRDDLSRILGILASQSRPVCILLDAWEEPLFRAKFAGLDPVSLDWPPLVDAGDANRTRAWRLDDRRRYLNGERVVTDRLR
jgi:hypothetical protein